MKKTLLALLSAVLVITAIQPVQAQDQKVLAIIDTAIDSKLFPQIIQEVCFNTHTPTCPNGSKFMEGPGAANLSVWPKSLSTKAAYHGDWIVKAALKADPTVKIVFIRYVEITNSKTYRNDARSLVEAIDWVSKNAEKYSIDALSISQSNTSLPSWCTGSTIEGRVTVDAVASLNSKNVPVFAATGNDAKANVVGFPSCVSGVIGVGALNKTKNGFEKANNGQSTSNPGIDIATFGAFEIQKGTTSATFPFAGSSGATVVSAATYLKNNTHNTFQEYMSALPKIIINTVSYSSN